MSDDMQAEIKDLYQTILSLQTEDDCERFFSDLCTYKEINSMAQRLKSAKLLMDGNTYEQVIKQTDISSATLSRVSRAVKQGSGYKKFAK